MMMVLMMMVKIEEEWSIRSGSTQESLKQQVSLFDSCQYMENHVGDDVTPDNDDCCH